MYTLSQNSFDGWLVSNVVNCSSKFLIFPVILVKNLLKLNNFKHKVAMYTFILKKYNKNWLTI